MKCERCYGAMLEEVLIVRGGPVQIRNVSAWHCTECQRIEYRSTTNIAAPPEGIHSGQIFGCSVDS